MAKHSLPIFSPGWRAFTDNKELVRNGKLLFFTDADAPLPVFADPAFAIPLGVEVDLNSGGYPITTGNAKTLIYTNAATFRVQCLDVDGVEIWNHEGVNGALDLAPSTPAAPFPSTSSALLART